MRAGIVLVLLTIASSSTGEDGGAESHPLLNVEIVDAKGVATALTGFYRLSGEFHFDGYLGASQIRVPYDRVREITLEPGETGRRPAARIVLHTGEEVAASYDEREGDVLFSGFADFGRVTVCFRDLRRLRILGRTRRSDLPDFGRATPGVDVRLEDSRGVATELVEFRRATGPNVVPGIRGATTIGIPLRIVAELAITPGKEKSLLEATARLRGGAEVAFRIPAYEEHGVYVGEAPFGRLGIHLYEIRRLVVHRATPPLRDLDPLGVAGVEPEAGEEPGR
jgi:hypothetical protein